MEGVTLNNYMHRVLRMMPTEFTSFDFLEKLRKICDFEDNSVNRALHANFLKLNCKVLSRKTFCKLAKSEQLSLVADPIERKLTDSDCIAFLKEKGYKVLKPVTEYEEV